MYHKTDIIDRVNSLNNALRKACNTAIPRKSNKTGRVPWWTPEITTAKKNAYRLRRIYQEEKHPVAREEKRQTYLAANGEYGKLIKTTKVEKWKKFATLEGNKNPWGQIYKMYSGKIRPQQIASSIDLGNNKYTTNWPSTARALLAGILKDDDTTNENLIQKRIREEIKVPPEGNSELFTNKELHMVINKMKNRKAPGPDNFDLQIIKSALKIIETDLLEIYNECLRQGVFPNRWKVGKIVAIRKGQKDETKTGSYRPICLLPIFGKILEALILLKLNKAIEGKMAPNQFGFVKGKSTEDAIVRFTETVDGCTDKYAIAIFLDIKGAFDNVWWPSVLHELKLKNCPKNIFNLVKDYLHSRKVIMSTETEKVEREVTRGCPQGSILGPTLWNLVFDSNLRRLNELDCEAIAYADDEVIIVTGNSREELQEKGQKAIDEVLAWCRTHKMQLATEKCEMILAKTVKNALISRCSPKIQIKGKSIKRVNNYKYLGITFSTKMQVKEHVQNIADKTKQFFNNLAKVARRDWGLGFKALRTIYGGLYVPIATYASAGWMNRLDKKTLDKFEKTQRTALIRVTGAYRTVSGHAMPVVAGVLPISLEAEKRILHYKLRRNLTIEMENIRYEGEDFSKDQRKRIKKEIQSQCLSKWQSRWNSSIKGRETHAIVPDINERMKARWIFPDHYLTQILTGHGNFKQKLYGFKLKDSPQCNCGENDSPFHILNTCHKFDEIRREYKTQNNITETIIVKEQLTEKAYPAFNQFIRKLFTEKETIERIEDDETNNGNNTQQY